MKNSLIALLLLLLFIPGFSQDLRYEVYGKYSRPVKEKTLNAARFIRDIVSGYPVNWITSYDSVVILATCDGKGMRAIGPDDQLTTEQKNILHTADISTDVVIMVIYKYKNPLTGIIENNTIDVSMTLVPETEAEYAGGHEQMVKYLKENGMDKISKTDPKEFKQLIIKFTVNEKGEIANAEISKKSTDPKADKLLLDVINKMPKWKPAENLKGIKVKQEFEFSVGNSGC